MRFGSASLGQKGPACSSGGWGKGSIGGVRRVGANPEIPSESGKLPAAGTVFLFASPPVRRKGRQDSDGCVERTEMPVRQPVTQEAGDELIWN